MAANIFQGAAAIPNHIYVMPWCRLGLAGGGSLTAVPTGAGNTKLGFDSNVFHRGWPVQAGTITDLILPFTGVILVCCHDADYGDGGGGTANTGTRAVGTQKNSSVPNTRMMDVRGASGALISGARSVAPGFDVESVNAGDTLPFICSQNSGGTLNVGWNDIFLFYFDVINAF